MTNEFLGDSRILYSAAIWVSFCLKSDSLAALFTTYHGMWAETEPRYFRPQATQGKVLDLERPDVAQVLNTRSAVVEKMFLRGCKSHFD